MKLNQLLTALALSALIGNTASAAEPLRVGLVLPMSGMFSGYGKQIEHGVRLYLQQNGGSFKGRKVEVVLKDDTGAAPETTRRLAQELIVRDKVDILAGFAMTPGAISSASVATSGDKPMIVMNAATSSVTTRSPNIVRTSVTVPQFTEPLGQWAVRSGIKKAFTLVADFGPGYDAEKQFTKTFNEGGGEIIGQVRTPVQNPDFAPYLQRIKDAKPDAVFLFLPAGEQGVAFLKGYQERGLAQAGIKLIATGDLTDEDSIDALGDAALRLVTAYHYSEEHDSPENKAYVQAYYKAYPSDRPNAMSVSGYDGMRLIHEALKKTGGDAATAKFMQAARGVSFMSPRGPITIDPETRDIIQNIYIRKVERRDGRLQNVEFDVIEQVRDPGKE